MKRNIFLYLLFLLTSPAIAQISKDALSTTLENYKYPYDISYIELGERQGTKLKMAYGDLPAFGKENGQTMLLLHGKNFLGAYWPQTIDFLRDKGYRVIVPDQIGFGKSVKPTTIQYSLHFLADNTKQLLDSLGIKKVSVIGHSMGGMLAIRFSLLYPERVDKLILENPIGLEDYRIKVPYVPLEQLYKNILGWTEESIRNYQKTYYTAWDASYDKWVQIQYRWTLGPEWPQLAMVHALTEEMIYTQPVVYELPYLKVQTLLVIGQEDRTTLGRGRVSKSTLEELGQYPKLGQKAVSAIPNARLIELKGVGHIPHLAATEKWLNSIQSFLK